MFSIDIHTIFNVEPQLIYLTIINIYYNLLSFLGKVLVIESCLSMIQPSPYRNKEIGILLGKVSATLSSDTGTTNK